MAFRLFDRLASNVMFSFDNWFISETDLGPGTTDEFSKGINPIEIMKGNVAALDRLDGKAGSLLTHISMMVAAASFMIASNDSSTLERVIISLEVTAYLFFALLCLRCLTFQDLLPELRGDSHPPNRHHEAVRREVLIRSKLLNISIRWVFLITFVFLFTVAAHLFL